MNSAVFDAHLHIIDPKFPLISNQGYTPPPFPVQDYLNTRPPEIVGGAIISASFQGFDQSYLLAALEKLGPSFVGVTQLPEEVTDQQIANLASKGVRALRFNLYRGGSAGLDQLTTMAKRVYDIAKWHIEIYADVATLSEMVPTLSSLPQIVIDHLGLSTEGLPTLLKLVDSGAKVKATGFSRVSLDIPSTLKTISHANPHALIFGTDLPCTRAPRPFSTADINLLIESLGTTNSKLALFDNAVALYKPNLKVLK